MVKELLWLDISSQEALEKSLDALARRWENEDHGEIQTDGQSLCSYLTHHLWPYLDEDFGIKTPADNNHSFEVP